MLRVDRFSYNLFLCVSMLALGFLYPCVLPCWRERLCVEILGGSLCGGNSSINKTETVDKSIVCCFLNASLINITVGCEAGKERTNLLLRRILLLSKL